MEEHWRKREPTKFVSYQVTATFLGRIDGVSPEIHQFYSQRSNHDGADYLGFGHMGRFDAQFTMQSVEGDAVLEKERPSPKSN